MALNDMTEQTTTQQILSLTASINRIRHQKEIADQLIESIASELGLTEFGTGADLMRQVKAERKAKELAILQLDAINTDLGEIRSERDYYRVILDKLCDRLNIKDIESLEHVAKYQEIELDYTSQHNEELQEQLANSQAAELKYTGRIFELERKVRSLERPELDLLSDIETAKLIRVLLSAIPSGI